MLTITETRSGALVRQNGRPRITEETTWIDLLNPTPKEEKKIERELNLEVPTRQEQQEIEISSRLYRENGAYFMTATILVHSDMPEPTKTPITFILAGQRLITVRYAEPRAFSIFLAQSKRPGANFVNGSLVLIETIVDRLADFIERVEAEVETLSHSIFGMRGDPASRQRRFDEVLRSIGREGEITSLARESAYSLGRLLTLLTHAAIERKEDKMLQARIRTAARDVQSLTDHIGFLSGKIVFLLDATLGMVSIQQNDIIKIVSVAAVVFLPPTLIASVYGMNFEYMPELKWLVGYPFAIILMVLSALLPYLYFRRRGWM
jgi:magnesium transporter